MTGPRMFLNVARDWLLCAVETGRWARANGPDPTKGAIHVSHAVAALGSVQTGQTRQRGAINISHAVAAGQRAAGAAFNCSLIAYILRRLLKHCLVIRIHAAKSALALACDSVSRPTALDQPRRPGRPSPTSPLGRKLPKYLLGAWLSCHCGSREPVRQTREVWRNAWRTADPGAAAQSHRPNRGQLLLGTRHPVPMCWH